MHPHPLRFHTGSSSRNPTCMSHYTLGAAMADTHLSLAPRSSRIRYQIRFQWLSVKMARIIQESSIIICYPPSPWSIWSRLHYRIPFQWLSVKIARTRWLSFISCYPPSPRSIGSPLHYQDQPEYTISGTTDPRQSKTSFKLWGVLRVRLGEKIIFRAFSHYSHCTLTRYSILG